MYIWNIDKLGERLISGKLEESEAIKYLMAYTVLTSLSMIHYSSSNQYDIFVGVACSFIAIFGLLFIYKCNGGRNGGNFMDRYFSIGWVIFIRFLVLLLIPLLVIFFILQEVYMGGVPEETTALDAVLILALEVIYIFWVARHINYVAKNAI